MRRRFLRSIMGAALLGAGLSACGDGTGPTPAARVEILADRTALVRQQELQIGAIVYDADDNTLAGREVQWSSSEGDVLSVSPSGLVRALSIGTARVTATVDGKSDELTFTVSNGFPVAVTGVLYPFAPASAEPMRISLRDIDGAAATVLAGSDGSFSLSGESATEAYDVVVEGENGLHLPALVRLQSFLPTDAVRILMTPARWSPPAGSYVGTTLSVDPVGAFEPPPTATGENYDGYWPGAWLSGIKVWSNELSPARLAFDRSRSDAGISDADSVEFWSIVRQMESDLGRPLFEPATLSELTVAADGWSDGAVLVRIDNTLSSTAGYANWRWRDNDQVYAGVVRLGSAAAFRHAGLVTHELLHTLGFKHSCSWPTVMGGYGCRIEGRMTAHDVAHAQLAFAMRDAERNHQAANALVAALNAQLVLQYDRDPVPVGSLAPWSGSTLLRVPVRMGQDGAY